MVVVMLTGMEMAWSPIVVLLTASGLLFVQLRGTPEAREAEQQAVINRLPGNGREVFWMVSPDWRRILYISPSYAGVWGRTCESLRRRPLSWLEAVHPEDRAAVAETFETALKRCTEIVVFPEYRVVRPDGSERWIAARGFLIPDSRGRIDHVAGIAEDITERKAAERALKERERQYVALYNQTPALLHSIDRNGAIIAISDLWLEKTGYTREELLGRSPAEIMAPESRAFMVEEALPGFYRSGRVRDLPFTVQCKDGSTFDGEMSSVATYDEDGSFRRSLGVTIDVTERNKAEEKFRLVQKYQAIGQLTCGLAHDFNNLLAVLILNLSLMSRGLDGEIDRDSLRARIDQMMKTAEKGSELTRSLLAFSRRRTLETKVLDLRDAITAIAPVLVQAARSSVKVEFDVSSAPLLIRTDEAQFGSALLNLIINSRDAMPNGGRVTVSAAVESPEGSNRANDAPEIRVAVTDTGSGIPEELRDRILEPFFTTKGDMEGSGLGLSMVQGFVKQCGGRLEIDSTVGTGTTVTLRFPCVVEADIR